MSMGIMADYISVEQFKNPSILEYTENLIAENNPKASYLSYIIHKGESFNRAENDYNRGSSRCRHSNRMNLRLVDMTVNEIMYYQNLQPCSKNVLFAVGKWQIIPETLALAVRDLKIDKSRKFNITLQNEIFVNYLTKNKRPEIYNYIITGEGLKLAAREVAREWASIGSPIHCKIPILKKIGGRLKVVGIRPWKQGGGCYDGLGTNRHLISADKNLKALQKARSEYVNLRTKGYSKDTAYRKSLGINE